MHLLADQSTTGLGVTDWSVIAAYLCVLCVVGWRCSLRSRRADGDQPDDFFLAGRSMPTWAVSLSLLATMLSAATFIGGPEISYAGDLTYLSESIGGMIAIVIVAVIFIPRFYRLGVTSIYELVGDAFGSSARRATSGMFLIGRVFASGARLFMVGIPFAIVAFGDASPTTLQTSIIIIAAVAAGYTMLGGIRAVIWTDALQAGILLVALLGAIWVAFDHIGMPITEIIDSLGPDPQRGQPDKLRIFDYSTDPSVNFTLWTALTGWLLFHVAAIGTDQDLAQRLLTCRSARRGAWAAIFGKLLSIPMTALFLLLGLLLFVIYQRPDLGTTASAAAPDQSHKAFVVFIVNDMPSGLRGLMIAGLFAAAMSSLDSALSAMGAATTSDFLPAREGRPSGGWRMRLIVLFWAIVLAAFACLCVTWQSSSGEGLIAFALGVMMFAYSGLLAVFLTALLTRRGNARSAMAALVVGFVTVAIMQPAIWQLVCGDATNTHPLADIRTWLTTPAIPWRMTIATLLSFIACITGRRSTSPEPIHA